MENPFENSLVKEIDGSYFENNNPWMLKNKHCAIVLFYASWCGHCHNFIPDYKVFADKVPFLEVYAIESEKNKSYFNSIQNTELEVDGFPTLYFFKNGKPIKKYEGDRSPKALIQESMKFCNQYCDCDTYN